MRSTVRNGLDGCKCCASKRFSADAKSSCMVAWLECFARLHYPKVPNIKQVPVSARTLAEAVANYESQRRRGEVNNTSRTCLVEARYVGNILCSDAPSICKAVPSRLTCIETWSPRCLTAAIGWVGRLAADAGTQALASIINLS